MPYIAGGHSLPNTLPVVRKGKGCYQELFAMFILVSAGSTYGSEPVF